MAKMEKFAPAKRISDLRKNVWTIFAELSRTHQPVHLGSGFPDMFPPGFVVDALKTAASNPTVHQETDLRGLPRLVSALKTLYSGLVGQPVEAVDVVVTIGAYEALYAAFTGLLNPGDEVILIEPFFDCYEAMIKMAEAVPVMVTLTLNQDDRWVLDMDTLRSKFTAKTKMIVINTPVNPIGKVFTRKELSDIADLCKEFDVVALMDEVYEWTVFDGEHVRMSSLDGMWERTITVGSCGKSFSVTGWRTGWAYGPHDLIDPLLRVHSSSINTCATVMQEAAALVIERELSVFGSSVSFWQQLPSILEERKTIMCRILKRAGFRVFEPQAGYFVVADFSKYPEKPEMIAGEDDESKDLRFAKWLCVNKKVLAIPPSAFYSESNSHEASTLLRFCYYKDFDTLRQLEKNLLGTTEEVIPRS